MLRRIADAIRDARAGVHRARGARHRHADRADEGARGARRRRTSTTTRGVIAELHGRVVPGRRRVPQLHDPQAGRRRRADHAVERAADALDLADRARARGWQHGRAQARGVVAADRDAARRACSRRPELPPGVFNVVHGFGETAGAALSAPPRRRSDLLHRRDGDRAARDRRGRADAQALVDRARRQVAGGRVRGRRPGALRRRGARADLHDERPALHRRLAPARRSEPLYERDRRGGRGARASGSASATRSTHAPSSGR